MPSRHLIRRRCHLISHGHETAQACFRPGVSRIELPGPGLDGGPTGQDCRGLRGQPNSTRTAVSRGGEGSPGDAPSPVRDKRFHAERGRARALVPQPARAGAGPVPIEYSIGWLTCAFASRRNVMLASLPGAAQDRLLAHVPGCGCREFLPPGQMPYGTRVGSGPGSGTR